MSKCSTTACDFLLKRILLLKQQYLSHPLAHHNHNTPDLEDDPADDNFYEGLFGFWGPSTIQHASDPQYSLFKHLPTHFYTSLNTSSFQPLLSVDAPPSTYSFYIQPSRFLQHNLRMIILPSLLFTLKRERQPLCWQC